MARFLIGFVVLLVAVLGALYYLVYAPLDDQLGAARREASLAAQEVSSYRSRVSDLENMLEELRQTSSELEARIRTREEELEQMKTTQNELISELEKEIAEGHVQVERLMGALRVDMVDEILFDSGQANIKPEGVEILRRVGDILKKVADKRIVVQGHTDNVPIVGRGWPNVIRRTGSSLRHVPSTSRGFYRKRSASNRDDCRPPPSRSFNRAPITPVRRAGKRTDGSRSCSLPLPR